MKEILSGQTTLEEQSPEIQANLNELLTKINIVRKAYGKAMNVSSGFRTMEHHLEIYAKKGITNLSKIPMSSNHLFGRAVDISDPNKELQTWVDANISVLENAGLWMEDFSVTTNWCHFQIIPPKSGARFFMP